MRHQALICDDCGSEIERHKECLVQCVKWPNKRGMTATVKSWKGDEQAYRMAQAQRLVLISVWPSRNRVEVDVETAGLRFTDQGQNEYVRRLREEAKRLGIRKDWGRVTGSYGVIIQYLPTQWVAEQFQSIIADPANVESGGAFYRRTGKFDLN